jgi:hypothetical protein
VHDGSSGFVLQSIGGCETQEGSLGFLLQSTGHPGVVLHDGSFGVVLQSIGPGGGGTPVEPEHSRAVEPSSHVGGGGGGGVGCSTVGGSSSISFRKSQM